jgi:2-phosphosulfolactate phosphatase
MTRAVRIHLLPAQFEPAELVGGVAVVIDVLRASTTIAVALANGAACVIPCADVDTARRLAAREVAGQALLGGERGGVRIDGFDLDNSPASYFPPRVAGKTIVFTTTNGTAALVRAREAARLLIGSLVNRRAIVDALRNDGRSVHLVCAGTDGRVTSEDELGAGAIAAALADVCEIDPPDSLLQLAIDRWQAESRSPARLEEALRHSGGGQNLVAMGFDADIRRAAEVDSIAVVPEYFAATGRIETAAVLGLGDRAGFR